MHYLYRIINRVNGKVYIGQTNHARPSDRWSEHKSSAKKSDRFPLQKAIRKYTSDNFLFDIVACCKTQEDANWCEEELIKQYDCLAEDKKGYNVKSGGLTRSGFKMSDEAKLKMRLAKLGKPSKKKGKPTGKPAWNKGLPKEQQSRFGKKHSPETLEKMRQAALLREEKKRNSA